MLNKISIEKVFNFILSVIIFILITFFISVVINNNQENKKMTNLFGYTPVSIISGSMEGEQKDSIKTGSLIFIKKIKEEDLKIGDIITFGEINKNLTTHRIIEIINEDNELLFKTKGDNNEFADNGYVRGEEIVGQMKWKIPYIAKISYNIKDFIAFTFKNTKQFMLEI